MAELTSTLWDLLNYLWIPLILVFFILPIFQRYAINRARRRALRKISRERGSQVITLIHRQEVISFLGIPISRYIDIDDSEEVLRAIRKTPHDTPIDLIMHTPGGIALAATQIAMALKAHPGKKSVIVPHFAMSGGTLIAMAADEILMDPHAVLGPVDPQLASRNEAYPASSILSVIEKKPIEKISDRTLLLAEDARKSMDQMKDLIRTLLKGKCGEPNTEVIIEELVSGKYTHDYPIFPDHAAKMLGDCVTERIPDSVYDLMDFYKMERGRRRPGVEYVPVTPPENERAE